MSIGFKVDTNIVASSSVVKMLDTCGGSGDWQLEVLSDV